MRLTPEVVRNAQSYLSPIKQRELDLRNLEIAVIENLGVTEDAFESIDLTDNAILRLENMPVLRNLRTLALSNNRVSSIAEGLGRALPALDTLVLTNNALARVADLAPLASLAGSLTHLFLARNAVMGSAGNVRVLVCALLPKLKVLDAAPVSAAERAQAALLAAQLKAGASIADLATPVAAAAAAPAATAVAAAVGEAAAPAALSAAVQAQLLAMLDEATSLAEVELIEQAITTGVIPQGLQLK